MIRNGAVVSGEEEVKEIFLLVKAGTARITKRRTTFWLSRGERL